MIGGLPNEQILERVLAIYKKIEGILTISDSRILWKKKGDDDHLYSVQEFRSNIIDVEQCQADQGTRFLIQLKINGGPG